MAQKKKTLSKKSNFFTKRKIALGVAIIALIGVGYILVSNASGAGAETDPVQKKLFCNQGKCYETQEPGTIKSDTKVFVRESSNPDCTSGKEWAVRQNKQAPKTWVCVEVASSNNNLPDGFRQAGSPCYTFAMPAAGFDKITGAGLSGSTCLNNYNYNLSSGKQVTLAVDSESAAVNKDYIQLAQSEHQRYVQLGQDVTEITDKYKAVNGTTVGGVSIRTFKNLTTKEFYVFANYAPTLDSNATVKTFKCVYIRFSDYTGAGDNGAEVRDNAKTTLASWQWKP